MKMATVVEAESYMNVRMEEDGTVTGKVVARMPYAVVKEIAGAGDPAADEETKDEDAKAAHIPMCSADVELTAEDAKVLAPVLKKIMENKQEQLAARLADARADCRRVARAMGELI